MISKKNSALIFDPPIFFIKNTWTDQNLTFLFIKNMKYSAALPMFLIRRENLLSYDNMRVSFFSHAQEVKGMWFVMKKYSQNSAWLVQKIICLMFNNKLTAHRFINCSDQLGGLGTPAKMLGEPEGLPEIFPRPQPCSPIVIGNMIHYMLLLNVEVHFLRTLVKECKF